MQLAEKQKKAKKCLVKVQNGDYIEEDDIERSDHE